MRQSISHIKSPEQPLTADSSALAFTYPGMRVELSTLGHQHLGYQQPQAIVTLNPSWQPNAGIGGHSL